MTTTILVVEDDERIRTAVRLALEKEGWSVLDAATGEEALQIFQSEKCDILLIDIMLPGMDGFEVCRSIRKISEVPVVMVTARDDTHDVVAGLEAGADDYLTKPFAPKELSARIRALLRRVRLPSPELNKLEFGNLKILPDQGQVIVNDQSIQLTRTEFQLLAELASVPDRVFSRDELLERVWGKDYFGDGRLVDVHIRRLRKKIEPEDARPQYVITVRGFGYKLKS